MSIDWLATGIDAIERGWIPDPFTRIGIRRLCRDRLRQLHQGGCEAEREAQEAFLAAMRQGPVAPVPEKANEQHYELPPEFFLRVLGSRLKYSCCWWPEGVASLDEAEAAALRLTCQRAALEDGQDVLELGCGWGSLTLWMAEHYPKSRISAVSNSVPQRKFIEARAAERGLRNVKVLTADMNEFATDGRYDRVVSIEMFEHMRNYERLLGRIAEWLRPAGKLFVHIFCHERYSYEFQEEGSDNWMGRYFFSGGIMPGEDLLLRFQRDLELVRRWRWSGEHYRKTAEAWLANLDRRREEAMPVLREVYGEKDSERWFHRWRVFFLACAELFGYDYGGQWLVAHYLFEKRRLN